MSKKIKIRITNKKYRGVFATARIKKGEVIESCPVVIIPKKEQKLIDKTHLFSYYFIWGKNNTAAIALGYGSLYNHSYNPNAEYEEDVKKQIIIFTALRDIKKGEEITTNYNGEPDSKDKVWFKVN